jgi:hypothetical protein
VFDEPWPVPAGAAADFARDGFVRLRGVLPVAAVAWLHGQVHAVLPRMVGAFDAGDQFRQAIGLWQADAQLRRVTCSRRLAGIIADLTGCDALRLWHDQALIKAPGGGPTLLHTDWHYMPVAAPPGWGLWLPLHDVAATDGVLGYVPGSHRAQELRVIPGNAEGHRRLEAWCQEQGLGLDLTDCQAGDLAVHDVRIVHGTRSNTGGRARSIYNIFYLRGDARREETPQTAFLKQNWTRNLTDVQPGAPFAASDAHPLLPSAYNPSA